MKKELPKLLFVDIETSPNIGYFWRPGSKVNIGFDNILIERQIICICYKWIGDSKVKSIAWNHEEDTDKYLLEEFLEVADKAELIVTHNGDRFDIPWIKGRIAIHGLQPLTKLVSIDTLKLCRTNFGFNSNRLDYLGQVLVGDRKIKTGGFDLWKGVMNGDKKALRDMVTYCNQDVNLLEKVFLRILPYVKSLPFNMGLVNGGNKDACPACASEEKIIHGYYYTATTKKERFKCKGCSKTWS